MKQQNGVLLVGRLADVGPALTADGASADGYVAATLVTDQAAYGGHHRVLFPAEHAEDLLTYWALADGRLEVAVEGWLRSGPAQAVVVVDRVIYLTVDEATRARTAAVRAVARQRRRRGEVL
jgi:hypothetical protein